MVIVGHIYAINVECRPTCCAIDNINRHSFVYWSVQISAISGHISVWRFLLCWCTMPSCDLRRQFILIVFWSILPHRVVRVQHFLYNNISVEIYIENESSNKQQNQNTKTTSAGDEPLTECIHEFQHQFSSILYALKWLIQRTTPKQSNIYV